MDSDTDLRNILRERARRLAQVPAPAADADVIELLEFGLADERYALLTAHVSDVQPLRDLTPLPGTPPFLRGLVNIRGRLVSVIDLKKFFDLPEPGITDLHRVVLLAKDGIEIGILADTVEGVLQVPAADIRPPLSTMAGIRAEYVRGVTGNALVVLDADAILDDQRIIIEEELA